jgi:hypothetical protein
MSSKHWVFIQVVKSPAERKQDISLRSKQTSASIQRSLAQYASSYACPNAQAMKQTPDNQLSQIATQIMTFHNHVRPQGLPRARWKLEHHRFTPMGW